MNYLLQLRSGLAPFEREAEDQFGQLPPRDFTLLIKNGISELLSKLILDVSRSQDLMTGIITADDSHVAM